MTSSPPGHPADLQRVAVVIPAFNEARTISQVVRSLRDAGFVRIVVVDDGSSDDTAPLARQAGATVLRHCVNVGLGGALGTGIAAAITLGAEVVVTCDADGQHAARDVARVVEPVLTGRYPVAIGSRKSDRYRMPPFRRLANSSANFITFLLFGIWCSDTQSGLRAFSREVAAKLVLTSPGMEVSSEIIGQIAWHRFLWSEVPIEAIYTRYSLSKGQSLMLGIRTLLSLLAGRIRRLS